MNFSHQGSVVQVLRSSCDSDCMVRNALQICARGDKLSDIGCDRVKPKQQVDPSWSIFFSRMSTSSSSAITWLQSYKVVTHPFFLDFVSPKNFSQMYDCFFSRFQFAVEL